MRRFLLFALTVLAVGLAGCGGDKGTGGIPGILPPSGGTGSGTILANVDISGTDVGPGAMVTDFIADLQDTLNAPINNATVTLNNANLGNIGLARDTLVPGRYRAFLNAYVPGSYTLTVTRGTESISNATVTAPVLHTITYPTPTDTLPRSAFNVLWSRSVRADTAEVETRDYGPALTSDDGNFTVPVNPGPQTDQRIRVRRINTILLAGGRLGSSLVARVRVTSEPVVVQ
jgi:hypothetical protein